MSDQKLDKILDKLTELEVAQARQEVLHEKNTEDLAEHIRRTEASEARIDILEDTVLTKKDIYVAFSIIGSVITFLITVLGALKVI